MNKTLPVFCLAGLRKFYHLITFLLLLIGFTADSNAQTVRTGKSYVNITRPNGGTFLPGDIIEVRATIAVTGGNSTNRLNYVRYNDTINLAKFDYIPGTLRMLSNEGRVQYQYQDGPSSADSDSAHIDLATGRLRFNIGRNAGGANVLTQGTAITNGGQLWGGNYFPPSFFGNTCIRVYSYRVQIKNTPTAVAIDSVIRMSAGNFRYRVGSSTTDQISGFPQYFIRIAPDLGLCSNAIGGNAILGESGGTFGSGATQNRAGGTSFVPGPYTFVNFGANAPNDNYYGLANRTSANGSTDNNISYPNSARVFTVWEIIGDHTGAADPIQGNPATNNGYAVIINASYETNRAFSQDIGGLCEDTYYEFSAWFRNICRRCGCDSTGRGASQTGYTPSPGNDSSGVKPNLTFQVDGIDLYTTGEIAFSGEWVKKGFIFRSRPGQTTANVTIRNNAPGGGGNDWAIDDIAVSTCLPNMSYAPSVTPNVCSGGTLRLEDTVRSYFDNYTYYKWQRSTDNGSSWADVTGVLGPIPPTWNGTAYEYVSVYTVPPAATNLADSGDLYRLITATSAGNLNINSCLYTDNTNIVTVNVLDCLPPLSTHLLHFAGRRNGNSALLIWSVSDEKSGTAYEIERSSDGISFERVAILEADAGTGTVKHYSYTDPSSSALSFYRLKLIHPGSRSTYSNILRLDEIRGPFELRNAVNPFGSQLQFDLSLNQSGRVYWKLVDMSGNIRIQQSVDLNVGHHQLIRALPVQLPAGQYILVAEFNGERHYKKLLKL
jgi:hypothetical protein